MCLLCDFTEGFVYNVFYCLLSLLLLAMTIQALLVGIMIGSFFHMELIMCHFMSVDGVVLRRMLNIACLGPPGRMSDGGILTWQFSPCLVKPVLKPGGLVD